MVGGPEIVIVFVVLALFMVPVVALGVYLFSSVEKQHQQKILIGAGVAGATLVGLLVLVGFGSLGGVKSIVVLPVLLIVVAVVVGLIVLAARGSKPAIAIIGGLAALGVVLFSFLAFKRTSSAPVVHTLFDSFPTSTPVFDEYGLTEHKELSAGANSRDAWRIKEGGRYLPTTEYTTPDAATRGLATVAAEELLTRLGDETPKYVYVDPSNNQDIKQSVFVGELAKGLPTIEVRARSNANHLDDEITLGLYRLSGGTSSSGNNPYEKRTGTFQVTVRNLNGNKSPQELAKTSYDHRTWMNTSLSNTFTSVKSGLTSTEIQATREAETAAAERILSRFEGMYGTGSADQRDVLRTHVIKEVARFTIDRFTQEIELPEGRDKVWRSAMLVRADTHELARLHGEIHSSFVSRSRNPQLYTTAGFFAVLIALYAGINSFTKGHYSGGLRVASIVLTIGVIAWLVVSWT